MVEPITTALSWLAGQTVGRMQHNISETGNPFFYSTASPTKAKSGGNGMAKVIYKRKPQTFAGKVSTVPRGGKVIYKRKPTGKKSGGVSGLATAGIAAGAYAAGYGTRTFQEVMSGETLTVPQWIPVIGGTTISKAGFNQPAGSGPATAAAQPPPTVWQTAPPPPIVSQVINYEIATERTIEPIRSGIVTFAEQQGGYYANYPGF